MTINGLKNAVRTLSVIVLSIALVLTPFAARIAHAETSEVEFDADANQKIIEESSSSYEEAMSKSSELQKTIADNEERISQINESMPKRQEVASAAIRELYSLDKVLGQLINMILGIEDIQSAITNLDYIEHIKNKNLKDLSELRSLKDELDTLQSQLSSQKEEADAAAAEASKALLQAQAAREEAQRKAQEAAERERLEAQEAAEKAAREAQASEASNDANSESTTPDGVSQPTSDGADWSVDKSVFVSEWAARIDNYLSGSPLSGQGRNFASAAWDYGVDPRWSPAISYTESSKGANCFKSHNAWGWGSISWDSWEEAIFAHVRGLARGYGYTISINAAKKYCPPNWQHWYNVTSNQMNLI